MQSYVSKWGNSLGIRIPKALATEVGLTEGAQVELKVKEDCIVIYRKKYELKSLLSKITDDNLHEEIQIGSPVGNEQW